MVHLRRIGVLCALLTAIAIPAFVGAETADDPMETSVGTSEIADAPARTSSDPTETAEEAADTPRDVSETYDLGFTFTTEDQRFSLRLWGGAQLRYTYLDYDQRVEGNNTDYSNFYVRRARLWLAGNAFDPRFTYYLHIQLEPASGAMLHDAWLEYKLHPLLVVGAGRNKVAYGLEFLNSGFGLDFVERSVFSGETDVDLGLGPVYPGGGTARFGLYSEASTGFATGGLTHYRSQGVQLRGQRGGLTAPTFEYQAGIWNGRGTRGASNAGTDHLYTLRVGYHPFGWIDWRLQGEPEPSERFKLALFASTYSQAGQQLGGFRQHGVDLAFMTQYRRLTAQGEWATETYDYNRFQRDLDREGWYVQAGYLFRSNRLAVVARYAEIERLKDPSYRLAMDSGLGVADVWSGTDLVPGLERRIMETTVGLDVFLNQWHRHEVLFDVSRLVRQFADDPSAIIDGMPSPIVAPDAQEDWRFRAMLQMVF